MSWLMRMALDWVVVSVVFMVAAAMLPEVKVRSWGKAFAAAAVFGVCNALLGWLLKFLFGVLLFLPALLSFGLAFLLVPVFANTVLLGLVDGVLGEEVEIPGLGKKLLVALLLSIALALSHYFLPAR